MNLLLTRAVRLVAAVAILYASLWLEVAGARAQSGPDVITALQHSNAYVSPLEIAARRARPGDLGRLEAQASRAANARVPEKLAIIHSFPSYDRTTAGAASDLRHTLNFLGVLVVVSPRGIGVSSDRLSRSELDNIEFSARPRCLAQGFAACAIFAGQQAVSQVQSDSKTNSRNASFLWLALLVVLAVVIGALLFGARRRRSAVAGQVADLRRAAGTTLGGADSAIETIEAATAGKPLTPEVRAEYDQALALRDQARTELERASAPEMLIQANQDAAQAALALQGVMHHAGITPPAANPLEAPGRRCFYCAHDDRPPYFKHTIEDGKGNNMEVDVCSVCEQRLQAGRQPEVATVPYNGAQVPWYAVPGNPWYYSYGGPSWQYWLPFMLGMDVGSWFGGGWAGGLGGWDGGLAAGGIDQQAGPTPDADPAEFGAGGWDSGGDFGSGDWGGDSGGDWGSGGDGWS